MRVEDQLQRATTELLLRLKQPDDRLHSWEHCYNFFHKLGKTPSAELKDQMALHLGFYLASYGMYRGSTALLQKDYKYLAPLVEFLTKNNPGTPSISVRESTSGVKMKESWNDIQRLLKILRDFEINQWDLNTLATKILLGTWVTTPAFDQSFKVAVKTSRIGAATCSKKNFEAIYSFINGHEREFQEQVARFHLEGYVYPAMRVVDLVFWHLGEGER